MLVSDLVNQYHNNKLSGGPKIATKTKGVEQLSKAVSSLEKGQIFEGTVKSVKGDKVTLGLSSGQNVTARLDKGVNVTEGQSVFFQVKSNEGGTVEIRPVSSEFGGNPTLLNALKSAGLPENETNLQLVNAMMKEQMPIDKDSIKDMIRLLRGNPGANIDTLVSMKKLDLPINEGMITQFENYKESEGAILKMVGVMGDEIPKALSGENVSKEDVIAFQNEVLNLISEDGNEGIPMFSRDAMVTKLMSGLSPEEAISFTKGLGGEDANILPKGAVMVNESGQPIDADGNPVPIKGQAIDANGLPVTNEEGAPVNARGQVIDLKGAPLNTSAQSAYTAPDGLRAAGNGNAEPATNAANTATSTGLISDDADAPEFPRDSIGGSLNKTDMNNLNRLMTKYPEIKELVPQLFDAAGRISPETKGSDLLKAVNQYFSLNPNVTKADMMEFLDSPPVKNLLNNLMSNHWTLEPKELTKKGAVDELYEKIEEDMEKLIQTSKQATHSEHNPVANTAQGVKDNLSFIREVNQLYQYVQIPLQMSGEKTTGELYVYANKRQKRVENDEITAFLHFDMEHLGSTDISVKLAGKKLNTKFFLEDDISFQLIEQNLPALEEKLNELGYTCSLEVENDSNTVNFVEDFLKQDAKSAGDIHRYSFDVRA